MDFAFGSGGAGVLTDIAIARGERIELHLIGVGTGDYAGIRMTFEVSPSNLADVPGWAVAAGDPPIVAPNPTTDACWIRFGGMDRLPSGPAASVLVHDTVGRLVRRLRCDITTAEQVASFWNGRNEAGMDVPAGVYIVSLAGYRPRLAARLTLLR